MNVHSQLLPRDYLFIELSNVSMWKTIKNTHCFNAIFSFKCKTHEQIREWAPRREGTPQHSCDTRFCSTMMPLTFECNAFFLRLQGVCVCVCAPPISHPNSLTVRPPTNSNGHKTQLSKQNPHKKELTFVSQRSG